VLAFGFSSFPFFCLFDLGIYWHFGIFRNLVFRASVFGFGASGKPAFFDFCFRSFGLFDFAVSLG